MPAQKEPSYIVTTALMLMEEMRIELAPTNVGTPAFNFSRRGH